MKWLAEKKKVRRAADLANAALDKLDEEVKAAWSEELKTAYYALSPITGTPKNGPVSNNKHDSKVIDSSIKTLAKSIKECDEEAYRSRMDAEETFDMAEKRLSTSMAREGTRKAITSWELHEKAIVKSQTAVKVQKRA
jgi:hypothetical protein